MPQPCCGQQATARAGLSDVHLSCSTKGKIMVVTMVTVVFAAHGVGSGTRGQATAQSVEDTRDPDLAACHRPEAMRTGLVRSWAEVGSAQDT